MSPSRIILMLAVLIVTGGLAWFFVEAWIFAVKAKIGWLIALLTITSTIVIVTQSYICAIAISNRRVVDALSALLFLHKAPTGVTPSSRQTFATFPFDATTYLTRRTGASNGHATGWEVCSSVVLSPPLRQEQETSSPRRDSSITGTHIGKGCAITKAASGIDGKCEEAFDLEAGKIRGATAGGSDSVPPPATATENRTGGAEIGVVFPSASIGARRKSSSPIASLLSPKRAINAAASNGISRTGTAGGSDTREAHQQNHRSEVCTDRRDDDAETPSFCALDSIAASSESRYPHEGGRPESDGSRESCTSTPLDRHLSTGHNNLDAPLCKATAVGISAASEKFPSDNAIEQVDAYIELVASEVIQGRTRIGFRAKPPEGSGICSVNDAGVGSVGDRPNGKGDKRAMVRVCELSDVCAICLGRYEAGEPVHVLPCLHIFHAQCLDVWIGANSSCPYCKRNLNIPPTGYSTHVTNSNNDGANINRNNNSRDSNGNGTDASYGSNSGRSARELAAVMSTRAAGLRPIITLSLWRRYRSQGS